MNLIKNLSHVKAKAYASLTALALTVMVPALAFADNTALETGAKTEIEGLATTVSTLGVTILLVVGAVVAVTLVMRLMKKAG